jgi:hypothetical protein
VVVVAVVITIDRLLLLWRCLLRLLFGVVGCIHALVVVLGSHHCCRLPLFSLFDRRVMATWSSTPPLYMESPSRRFSDQEAHNGSVAPAASISKRLTA